MNRAQLKDRWRNAAGQSLAREVVSRLVTGRSLEDLSLGTVKGRADARALWLASLRGIPGVRSGLSFALAQGQVVQDVDFSYGGVAIHFDGCQVRNVVFDRVCWPDWRVVASTVVGCSFVGADFRSVRLDGWNDGLQDRPLRHPSSSYEGCDFTRTRTGGYASYGRATFTECAFHNTGFANPEWLRGANLIRCTFSGRYREVCFGWTGPYSEPPPVLEAVDVTTAQFASLEVYAVRGSGLITRPGQVMHTSD